MVEVSVILPIRNEEKNLDNLLPQLKKTLAACVDSSEIVVVDGGSADKSAEVSRKNGVHVLAQKQKGFAAAIKEGIGFSRGKYILTMDADGSHPPEFIREFIDRRKEADLVIGSRFIEGASFHTNSWRKFLSLILNKGFKLMLSLPVSDSSSGFRIYRASILRDIRIESSGFDIQLELLIKIIARGYQVKEMPLSYRKRIYGRSKAHVVGCGLAFLRSSYYMYILRNSILSADYDDRACRSRLLPQRLWHKFKDKATFEYVERGKLTLDAGCGTGSFIQQYDKAVGMDIEIGKARYLKRVKKLVNPVIVSNVVSLPFKDKAFQQVICSEVIEHVNKSEEIFKEFNRVLAPCGRLVLTTPDYSLFVWPFLEFVYGRVIKHAYADKHVSHYDFRELKNILEKNGFEIMKHKLFFGSVIIIDARKL